MDFNGAGSVGVYLRSTWLVGLHPAVEDGVADCGAIQGYRRNKIYPDFIVQEASANGRRKKPVASVLVLESKAKHLKGNEDSGYKRSVAEYFGKVGRKVPWQKLAEDFGDQTFRVQVIDEGEYSDLDWRDQLRTTLSENGSPLHKGVSPGN